MLVSTHADITTELIDDFFYDFNTSYERCEEILIELEQSPDNNNLTNDLFRSVHTIKGNLIYIGLKDLIPILQGVEDILELLRSGKFYYDDLLSDLILLAMDKTKLLIDENLFNSESNISEEDFHSICDAISLIAQVERRDRQRAMFDAIRLLDPNTQLKPIEQGLGQQHKDILEFIEFLDNYGVSNTQDISFISQLIPSIEERSSFWAGRSFRIARLSLMINQQAGCPVDPSSLTMACLMHDLSMAFLPMQMLHKEQPFTATEKRQMHQHVRLSHDLLVKMTNWDDASEIVLQHHERNDGSGYPKGLTDKEICPGAKILAIADTFDACCYARAYKAEQKRPLIRSILEVNRQAGGQFDAQWVESFNQVAKQHFVTHN